MERASRWGGGGGGGGQIIKISIGLGNFKFFN